MNIELTEPLRVVYEDNYKCYLRMWSEEFKTKQTVDDRLYNYYSGYELSPPNHVGIVRKDIDPLW